MMFWKKHAFIRSIELFLPIYLIVYIFHFLPSCSDIIVHFNVATSHCLIHSLLVFFPLFLIIFHHKIKYVDRVHGKICEILLLILHFIFQSFVHLVSFIFTPCQNLINMLITNSTLLCFQGYTSPKLKHILNFLLC